MALKVNLDSVGKKYYQQWIFKDLSYDINPGNHVAVIGSNGSGKSTLLKLISGQALPSSGKISFSNSFGPIPYSQIYLHLSWAGPFLDPYPDLTLLEYTNLHFRFKQCLLPDKSEIISILRFEKHIQKQLRNFSSGMLQRLMVGMALFSKSDLLLLDEPTSNMDTENAAYTLALIKKYLGDRTYVLASNLPREYESISSKILLKTK